MWTSTRVEVLDKSGRGNQVYINSDDHVFTQTCNNHCCITPNDAPGIQSQIYDSPCHVSGSKDLLKQYPEFDHYIETIWDNNKDNWIEPIGSFCWKDQTIGNGDNFDNIEKNYRDAIDFEMNANLQYITDSPMIYKFKNTNQ